MSERHMVGRPEIMAHLLPVVFGIRSECAIILLRLKEAMAQKLGV